MVRKHILLLAVICIFVAVINFFEIGCPFLRIFGIPCPTCGVTRATLSLLRGDPAGYLSYQPFALPLLAAVWLLLHQRLFRKRRLIVAVSLSVVGLNFVYYLFRLSALL